MLKVSSFNHLLSETYCKLAPTKRTPLCHLLKVERYPLRANIFFLGNATGYKSTSLFCNLHGGSSASRRYVPNSIEDRQFYPGHVAEFDQNVTFEGCDFDFGLSEKPDFCTSTEHKSSGLLGTPKEFRLPMPDSVLHPRFPLRSFLLSDASRTTCLKRARIS